MAHPSQQRLSAEQKLFCARVVTDYQRYVYHYANLYFSYVQHTVDEVFQEVLGLALSNALIKGALPEVGTPAFFYWLKKTTLNVCSNVRDFQNRSAGIVTRKRDLQPSIGDGCSTTEDTPTVNCAGNVTAIDVEYPPSGLPAPDEQYERAECLAQVKSMVVSNSTCLNRREKQVMTSMLNDEEDVELSDLIPFRQIPQYRQRAVYKLQKAFC